MYNIMFPEVISTLKQEFKSLHDKLPHPHHKSMFIIAKRGVLPSRFIYLKDDVPLCSLCMFGIARIS